MRKVTRKFEFSGDLMNKKCVNILIAHMFNIVLIVMSILMMKHYYDDLQIIFCFLGSIYLVYWIISNRKSYMSWSVYVHLVVGVVAQVLLNGYGIIPKDGGWFPGLGQFFYIIFLLGYTLLIGLANLILYVIAKRKIKKSIMNKS